MNDLLNSSTILVISDDQALVDALTANIVSGYTYSSRDSVQFLVDDPALLDGNSIVIFDVGTNNNDLDAAIDQTVRLKQADPTQALILVGDQELLAEVLKSRIQPLVFRAFPKPVRPNQVALAFNSGSTLHAQLAEKQAAGEDITIIGPSENKTNVATMANADNRKPLLITGLGVLALAVAGWLIFSGEEPASEIVTAPAVQESSNSQDEPEVVVSAVVEKINQLNQNAAAALLDNRVISPDGDNALHYYQQVLALDAYDTTAYQGKRKIADQLRGSYRKLLNDAAFDRALKVIDVLQTIDPLNPDNDKLRSNLQAAIDKQVEKVQTSGTASEVSETAAILGKVENKIAGSKSTSEALKAEQAIVEKIDQALASGLLIPPKNNNAYALVSEALKTNSVSNANISSRVEILSDKLLALADASLKIDDFEETDKLTALINRLNVDQQRLAEINTKIAARKAEIEASRLAAADLDSIIGNGADRNNPAQPIAAKIIPAEVVSQAVPRYPNRALNRGVEGWVEVTFFVDTNGAPFDIKVAAAEPKGLFENSAIKAVKKWRFDPARIEETGEAVTSKPLTTKVQFRLE